MDALRIPFFTVLALGALAGVAVNAGPLFSHPYLWPAVRLAGYLSLLVYALFMLWRARYNTRS